jgi:hypothetical protein
MKLNFVRNQLAYMYVEFVFLNWFTFWATEKSDTTFVAKYFLEAP